MSADDADTDNVVDQEPEKTTTTEETAAQQENGDSNPQNGEGPPPPLEHDGAPDEAHLEPTVEDADGFDDTLVVRTPEEEAEIARLAEEAAKAKAEEEARQQREELEKEEDSPRVEVTAEEEAAWKVVEEEAAASQKAEDERVARAASETVESKERRMRERQEAKAFERILSFLKAQGAVIEARQAAEEKLQKETDAKKAELERLRGILTRRDEERARVEESQKKVQEEEQKLDEIVVRRDEVNATKDTLQLAVDQIPDPDAITKTLEDQEQVVAEENLQHVWEESVKEDDLAKAEPSTLNLADLSARLAECASLQEHWVHRANDLMLKAEQQKSLATLETEEAMTAITKSFESEKRQLASTRKQLKALESEQSYHIRRGTYIKDPQANAPKDKDFEGDKEMEMHNHTCAGIVDEKARFTQLTDDVRGLRRDLDVERNLADDKISVLQDEIDEKKSLAEEMEWERELLSLEAEDLAAVKKELIAVTAAVKHQKK